MRNWILPTKSVGERSLEDRDRREEGRGRVGRENKVKNPAVS